MRVLERYWSWRYKNLSGVIWLELIGSVGPMHPVGCSVGTAPLTSFITRIGAGHITPPASAC